MNLLICRHSRHENTKLPNSRTIARLRIMSSYTDAAVSELRSIVAVIDQEMLQLPTAALREAGEASP
jgi:hypothetical protein